MRFFVAILVILVCFFAACKKTNNISNIPQISALSLFPDSIKAGSSQDTVYLQFHFRDGDADIGNDPNGTNYDIFVIDSRHNDTTGYFFPEIANQVKNPATGIEGDCTIFILAALIPVDSTKQLDSLHYTVYMQDQALHHSNVLTTSTLYIHQ